MCTMIATSARIHGSAKGAQGWGGVDQVVIAYDHATRTWTEHAVRLDFRDSGARGGDQVAIEMDLDSGKALLEQLSQVIASAERSGV